MVALLRSCATNVANFAKEGDAVWRLSARRHDVVFSSLSRLSLKYDSNSSPSESFVLLLLGGASSSRVRFVPFCTLGSVGPVETGVFALGPKKDEIIVLVPGTTRERQAVVNELEGK